MGDHSQFSPSSSSRWLNCPASWRLSNEEGAKGKPSKSTPAAIEGTCAHQLGEIALRKSISPMQFAGKRMQTEIDGEVYDFEVTEDMARHVTVYYDHCQTLAMLADRVFVEVRFHAPLIVHGRETDEYLHGTTDFGTISGNRVDIVDLKYGTNPVEPENNSQGISYLLGLIAHAKSLGHEITEGAIHICQPRVQREVKTWEIEDIEALQAEWNDRFARGIERCIEVMDRIRDYQFKPGPHCHYCPKIATCKHFAMHAIDKAQSELEVIEQGDDGQILDLGELVQRFEMKKLIARYYEKLEEYLKAAWTRGSEIPGYKVVQAVGNRRWTLDDETIAKKLYNKGIRKPDLYTQKLISPAQAERLLDDQKFFSKFVERPLKGKVLVPIKDKREALTRPREELETLPVETEEEIDLSMLG